MASKVPYDLIVNRIRNTVGQTYPIIEWSNVASTLSQLDQNFLAVEDVFASGDVVSVGTPTNNWFEEEGELDIHIFVKASDGYDVARTIAEEIGTSLRMVSLSNEVRVYNVGPANAGLIADGLWSSMIVGLTYRYIYTAPTFV